MIDTQVQTVTALPSAAIVNLLQSAATSLHESRSVRAAQGPGQARVGLCEVRAAIEHILRSMISSQQYQQARADEHLDRAAALLGVELSTLRSVARPGPVVQLSPRLMKGGLAPWQVQRIKAHVEARLGDGPLQNQQLAALVGLNPFHFCRAFRRSFGESPHAFVMRLRVERARALLLEGHASLSEIASDCGFADQAHFNRSFRKRAGEAPGAWRRARFRGAAPAEQRM
jgi:AraC family transcriptional regulator